MMKHAILVLTVCIAVALGCTRERETADDSRVMSSWEDNLAAFSVEVQDLQKQLEIPGLAFAVIEDGTVLTLQASRSQTGEEADLTTSTPVNTQSITKVFAAILVMQLVSEGKLDLATPVHRILPESGLPQEVEIEHLLTHTSEGVIGEQYIYSGNRYSLLQEIIEQAGGAPFEELLRERIIEPASMQWHDSPRMGSSWGLVSTVEDLSRFVQALDRGDLLAPSDLQRLATPTTLLGGDTGPISLGWFAQKIQGVPVMWSYGQGADRGESSPGEPLPRPDWRSPELDHDLRELEDSSGYSYEGELVAQILITGQRGEVTETERLFQVAADHYDIASRPDPVVHYATNASPEYASSLGIPMGRRLLDEYPNNRWILLIQGELLLREKDATDESADAFRRILALPNQQPDFLHRLFKSWSWLGLAEAYRVSDPTLSQQYLRELIGCENCPSRDQATAMLQDLETGSGGA